MRRRRMAQITSHKVIMQCLLLTTLIVTALTASPNLPSHTHGVAGMTRGKAEATVTDNF
jgi:hypothetical protein